jgi:hypothetical protein
MKVPSCKFNFFYSPLPPRSFWLSKEVNKIHETKEKW